MSLERVMVARRKSSERGFSLVEAMVSLVILAVGILGVAQMQIMASRQNLLSRDISRASTLARDFVASAQRWGWNDPRLQPGMACNATDANFPVTEALVGNQQDPAVDFDYTATPAGHPNAAKEAKTTDGLVTGGTAYDGLAESLLAQPAFASFQLLWTVRDFDMDADGSCETRRVSVVVRHPTAVGYRNLVHTFATFDSRNLRADGLAEQF